MNIGRQILVLILCFTISFIHIRGFLYGVKRYQLNNSALKKRKKGETFKEWLLYSRYKNEIPRILLALYYSILLIHIVGFIVCPFLYILKLSSEIGEAISKIIACFDAVSILLICFLFWSPKRADFVYERWIPKKRGK